MIIIPYCKFYLIIFILMKICIFGFSLVFGNSNRNIKSGNLGDYVKKKKNHVIAFFASTIEYLIILIRGQGDGNYKKKGPLVGLRKQKTFDGDFADMAIDTIFYRNILQPIIPITSILCDRQGKNLFVQKCNYTLFVLNYNIFIFTIIFFIMLLDKYAYYSRSLKPCVFSMHLLHIRILLVGLIRLLQKVNYKRIMLFNSQGIILDTWHLLCSTYITLSIVIRQLAIHVFE
ncbi:hypothetical protein ACJX0J_010331 [Zea mays]